LVVVFPSPNKNLATNLVALLVLPKDLVVVFDLIYVVIVSSSKFYSSELTKFELLTTIVEHNCVYFIPTLRINVFSY